MKHVKPQTELTKETTVWHIIVKMLKTHRQTEKS